jgi:hypothetical protein
VQQQVVVAEVLAVIGGEDDDRVLRQPAAVELVEQGPPWRRRDR